MSAWLIVLKGAAMGAADVVPGVSGGTIALITGIYDRLIDSLRAFDLKLLRVLIDEGIKAGWQRIDGSFLALLALGIFVSLFSLAGLISHLMTYYPAPVYSLFMGLIVASSVVLIRDQPGWTWRRVLALFAGAALMLAVSQLRPVALTPTPPIYFLAGAVAICAMILPGISGSFLLLIMGMYQPVLNAVHQLELVTLAIFIVGCVTGLLLFVRLLSWILHHYRMALMAFLTGVLLASLNILWPWKTQGSGGAARNVLPTLTWVDAVAVSACLLCGIVVVLGLHHWAVQRQLSGLGNT